MSNCKFTKLTDRSIIRISGSDCETFLKDLITNDVQDVTSNGVPNDTLKTCFAGLLTPQGKILYDFIVIKHSEAYYLDTAADNASELIKRLTFYKLRADVEILSLQDTHHVYAIWPTEKAVETGTDDDLCYPDPRLASLGSRCISDNADLLLENCQPSDEATYHAHRIAHGVPQGGRDYTYGDAFPHEVCYDHLGGVDFRKGCYVGQEVVSRMQHRGTARTRILIATAKTDLPESGTDLLADGKPVGAIGLPEKNMALTLVRLDRATRAIENGHQINAAGIDVTLTVPDWADYDVG